MQKVHEIINKQNKNFLIKNFSPFFYLPLNKYQLRIAKQRKKVNVGENILR